MIESHLIEGAKKLLSSIERSFKSFKMTPIFFDAMSDIIFTYPKAFKIIERAHYHTFLVENFRTIHEGALTEVVG